MARTIANLTDKRFGDLVVVSFSHAYKTPNGSNKYMWNVVCDCGEKAVVCSSNLNTGKTKSCGCKQRGIGNSSRYKGKASWLSKIYLQYQSGARKRNLTFELTLEQVELLTQSDCRYCGVKPAHRDSVVYKVHSPLNGIDRKDGSKGYTIDNVVTCCTTCNRMKMALNESEFLTQVIKIANHV